jgi:hypothetical protein
MTKTSVTGRKSSRKITLTPKMKDYQSERERIMALQQEKNTMNKEADDLAEMLGNSMKLTGMSPKPIQPEIRELSVLFEKTKIGGKKNRKTKKRANKKKSRASRRYW